jgi:formylglycine-generating enzyme required for sulfatase activity
MLSKVSISPASGQSFRDRLANGVPCTVCPEMMIVPAGTFTMGSPPSEPGRFDSEEQVPVTITRPFAVGKFAVTFDQWDACVADGGCNGHKPDDKGWGRGNRPVINVNWNDAKAFAEWLSLKTGMAYRLLSEAEHEYVTRAGTTTPFWRGSSISPNKANYNGDYTYVGGPKGEYRGRTGSTISRQTPGAFSTFTATCGSGRKTVGMTATKATPGMGAPERPVTVIGMSYPKYLRAAFRFGIIAGTRGGLFGFRLARTL